MIQGLLFELGRMIAHILPFIALLGLYFLIALISEFRKRRRG